MSDRFCDPYGWLLMKLPWPLRRLVIAWRMKVRPSQVPDGARYIVLRRPPRWVFDHARELARKHGW